MKIYFAIILLFLSFQFYAQCDFVLANLNSQKDIDDFLINEPDCKDVSGSIIIRGTNIVSLEGLSHITSIKGELTITNTALSDVSGLNNLESVGWLQIESNESLMHLDHLNKLDSIHNNLVIKENSSLISINGLSQIKFLSERFHLRENNIKEIVGFNNLLSLGSIYITREKSMKRIDGFNNLVNSTGAIGVDNCDSISIISGFEQLEEIGGNFFLNDFISPLELDAFSTLERIRSGFEINNTNLSHTLTLFDNLESIGFTLTISQCNLAGVNLSFSNLLSVKGEIDITGNENEFSIGFNRIRFVGNDVDINSNSHLKNIAGFNNLLAHLFVIEIIGNLGLEEISGFGLLLKSHEEIIITGNLVLEKISGFTSLKETNGLELLINPMLESISGFNSLETIDEFLNVNENGMLQTFDAFQNLIFVGGDLEILKCTSLSDISGLSNFDPSEIDEIYIEGNPSLSYCHIESICNSIIRPDIIAIIADNDNGCNSISEIHSNCETTNVEELQMEDVAIFPNPVDYHLTILGGDFSQYEIIGVDGIYITSGTFDAENIDVSALNAGLYVLTLQNNRGVYYYKFVKSD